ncbi:MAG: FimB/Mfa2 family fimbrial subunit, partial [Bacteroides sp.]
LLVLNLNDYLEDLRFLSHQHLPKQEFLDRQDEYAILFLMGDKGFYGSFEIEINGWLIREAGYGKE